MYSLCVLTVLASVLCLCLTPLIRDASVRVGLVDRPDHKRKLHTGAIPRTGGVPILLSYVGAYGLSFLLPLKGSGLIASNLAMIGRLFPPVAIIFLTGLLDDWLDLAPWQKLAGQLTAAAWAYVAGVRILGSFGQPLPPWCGLLLTVLWLTLCSNAFNLIDGIDGLATGVGLTAALTTAIVGILHGDMMLGLATAPLAGCLIAFLRYNFNPASIFLGDSGSLLIGFLLGSYAIIWSQKTAAMLGIVAPAMALALPLIEVALSVLRRFLGNQPILAGDRGHIHHRLLERGFTPRHVTLLLYAACGIAAALSLLESFLVNRLGFLWIVLFAAVTWIGVRYLGYVEFAATRRLWVGLRPLMGAHVHLAMLERSLQAATTVDDCWLALDSAARSLGYSRVTARLGGARFVSGHWPEENSQTFWQMRLNLPQDDYVNVTQREGATEQPALVVPFVDVVSRVLPEKLVQLNVPRALAEVVEFRPRAYSALRNSRTKTVMSSDCAAPSVNPATAS